MSGYIGDLSAAQQTALDAFKQHFTASHPHRPLTDHECLRFLRARQFNLVNAQDMFRNFLVPVE
jgi:hypothetical protein